MIRKSAAACGVFGVLVLALWTVGPAAAEEDIATQIKGIDQSIASVDEELGRHDIRIEKCDLIQYYRQKRYWQVHRQLAQEDRDGLTLRKKILQAGQAGKPVPEDLSAQLEELQKRQESRKATGEALEQARSLWQRVEGNMQKVERPYGWHLTKLNLLRDLVYRCRRTKFYLQEAMRPVEGASGSTPLPEDVQRRRLAALAVSRDLDTLDLGPVYGTQGSSFQRNLDELTRDTSRWLEQYGDCFYGVREQPMLGQVGQAEALFNLSEAMVAALEGLEQRREDLTERVLQFLARFDKDGKFASLGIPYRKEVAIDTDGNTSDLLFCTMTGGGHGGSSREQEEPLCFDVTDFVFFGVRAKAPSVIEGYEDQIKQAASDAEQGYYVKMPILLMVGGSPLAFANTKLLPADQQDDEDLFGRNADGNHGPYPNIWHPAIRELVQANLSALGRFCRTIPNFILYDKLTWEPFGLLAPHEGGSAQEAGYSPQAIAAFREHLEKKFRTIADLNDAWRTDYAAFGDIQPPPDPFVAPRRRATPLSYEFELFRNQSYGDYVAMAADAIRQSDSDHPIAAEIHTGWARFPSATALGYQLMSRVPVEFIEDHYNSWSAHYTCLSYLHSLCHYAGKKPIHMEYIWTYPRLITPRNEDEFRVTGELSIWRNMVWGRKILNVFGVFDGWGYRHNYMDEAYSCELSWSLGASGRIIREAGVAIPMGKKRSREFWPYLDRTEVVKPKIALVVPGTTMVNEYPYHPPHSGLTTVNTEIVRFERFLTPRDLDFRYVPEEVIVSGQEDLAGFNVIILPYAPYFPTGLAEKLLTWTRQGGTLISSGVPGIYDPYGFEVPGLMKEVFGSQVGYSYAGDDDVWRWDLTLQDGVNPVSEAVSSGDRPVMVSADYGQGRVLVTAESFFGNSHQRGLQAALAHVLEESIGWPTAASDHHAFEMVTRQDGRGQRYLFVVNPDLSDPAVDYVTVDGEYSSVIDLGIGSHCQVPLAPRQPMAVSSRSDCTSRDTIGTLFISVSSLPGRTTFQLRLAPGEGTVLQLVK